MKGEIENIKKAHGLPCFLGVHTRYLNIYCLLEFVRVYRNCCYAVATRMSNGATVSNGQGTRLSELLLRCGYKGLGLRVEGASFCFLSLLWFVPLVLNADCGIFFFFDCPAPLPLPLPLPPHTSPSPIHPNFPRHFSPCFSA